MAAKEWFIAVALAVSAWAPQALASDEEIISAYEESAQAWSEGRVDEADSAGETAWRMAEEEWGPVEDTALLAEALVQQRLIMDRREAAREPAARVVELIEAGAADSIPPQEARLALELANFDLTAAFEEPKSAATRENLARLTAALEAAEAGGMAPNRYRWMGWLDLARVQSVAGDWEQAYLAGDEVINLMTLTGDVPDNARVEAAVLAGNAAVAEENFADAARAFTWALDLTPQYVRRGERWVINPAWASLASWGGASAMAHQSFDNGKLADLGFLQTQREPGSDCALAWEDREVAPYPARALQRGTVGAAIVQFELDGEGRTQSVVTISATPPDTGFEESAADSVRKWVAQPGSIEGCQGETLAVLMQYALSSRSYVAP